MGFPSSGIEGLYRNPMGQVKKYGFRRSRICLTGISDFLRDRSCRFFESKHAMHYKVFNLYVFEFHSQPMRRSFAIPPCARLSVLLGDRLSDNFPPQLH